MAFFKFRKGGDEHPTPAPAPESVEALRKRARHRLIGAAILVLLGVVGFPLLFDNQPRPIAVDIPIEIPDKTKVKPLTSVPPVASATVPAAAPVQASAAPAAPASRAVAGVVSAPPTAAAPKPAAKPEVKVEAKPEVKPEVKPQPKPLDKPTDAAKAQALLDGKDAAKKPEAAASAASAGRFIVQIGAYAEVLKAREARQKLEKAGIKTYTQVVQTPEGKRIRVRVGPFESKAEADKAAAKIKKLDLPAAILEL
ncbi:MAG TPA: SPOR domain-containing protein [Rhodoferax sp.]|jgi:DedD protein|nr:SPOR domain-containing protein [Rhodoferax sp.]HOF51805.1 SPOR domain-containing protein [Rhodoferax sp.]